MVKSWRRRIGILAGVFLMGVSCVFPTVQVHAENEVETQANESVMVSYSTHVQKKGWTESIYNGESSGTTGSSLRLEGLKIQVSNIKNYSGNIEYRSHVQTYGWEKDWKKNGQVSGTVGQSKRLEAVEIRLTGELSEKYDVYYRVHSQTYGWLGWTKNGKPAGTSGYSKRLEAIQIMLVDKGTGAPGDTGYSYLSADTGVQYQTHVQTYGWQGMRTNGYESGTTGLSKRLESIQLSLKNQPYKGNIEYQTHVQTYGWEKDWKKNGEKSGTEGQSKRLEAIRIRLTGEIAEKCDVYYRVHAQHYGWLGWAKNGEEAGTAGFSYRLESIQVMVLPKNARTFTETAAFIEKGNSGNQTVPATWSLSQVKCSAGGSVAVNTELTLAAIFTGNANGVQTTYSWKNEITGETGEIATVGATETVKWTPTVSGKYVITAIAQDANGRSGSKQLTVQVNHGAILKSDAFFTAHRGLRGKAPDNSIPAFTLAGQAGFDSIETDVNETKDGVFVLSHDNNLSSICGVNVNISDLTYEELCNYSKYNIKIGNGVGNYNNYERRIPRLDEFLDICEQYGCIPQLDTKNLNSFDSVKELYQILEERGIQNEVIMTSFNNLYLQLLREMNPNITLTYGIESAQTTDIEWLKNYNVGVSVNSSNLVNGDEKAYVDSDIMVNIYSVKDKTSLGILMDRGITSFTVDNVMWDQ